MRATRRMARRRRQPRRRDTSHTRPTAGSAVRRSASARSAAPDAASGSWDPRTVTRDPLRGKSCREARPRRARRLSCARFPSCRPRCPLAPRSAPASGGGWAPSPSRWWPLPSWPRWASRSPGSRSSPWRIWPPSCIAWRSSRGRSAALEVSRSRMSRRRGSPTTSCPIYTVLVPAYREPSIMARLIASLAAINYPTRSSTSSCSSRRTTSRRSGRPRRATRPPYIEIVRVPHSMPKTKPKACLVGLATARGEFVTIYDAEDRPGVAPAPPGGRGVLAGRLERRVPPGAAELSQRRPEPADPVVHRRVRALVLRAASRPRRRAGADPARRDLEPFPPRDPRVDRRMGSRGTSPRMPTWAFASTAPATGPSSSIRSRSRRRTATS